MEGASLCETSNERDNQMKALVLAGGFPQIELLKQLKLNIKTSKKMLEKKAKKQKKGGSRIYGITELRIHKDFAAPQLMAHSVF